MKPLICILLVFLVEVVSIGLRLRRSTPSVADIPPTRLRVVPEEDDERLILLAGDRHQERTAPGAVVSAANPTFASTSSTNNSSIRIGEGESKILEPASCTSSTNNTIGEQGEIMEKMKILGPAAASAAGIGPISMSLAPIVRPPTPRRDFDIPHPGSLPTQLFLDTSTSNRQRNKLEQQRPPRIIL